MAGAAGSLPSHLWAGGRLAPYVWGWHLLSLQTPPDPSGSHLFSLEISTLATGWLRWEAYNLEHDL